MSASITCSLGCVSKCFCRLMPSRRYSVHTGQATAPPLPPPLPPLAAAPADIVLTAVLRSIVNGCLSACARAPVCEYVLLASVLLIKGLPKRREPFSVTDTLTCSFNSAYKLEEFVSLFWELECLCLFFCKETKSCSLPTQTFILHFLMWVT